MDSITARGRYLYLCNGEEAPVEESWERHSLGKDRFRVVSVRRADDVCIRVEALQTGAHTESCSVRWWQEGLRDLLVSFEMHAGELRVSRRDGQAREECSVHPLPNADAILFPLKRVFAGPVIGRLLELGGEGLVILPELGADPASDELLRPRFSHRRAQLEEIEADGSRRCLYPGDQYDDSARFWLAGDGLLARYRWRQDNARDWDVRLIR